MALPLRSRLLAVPLAVFLMAGSSVAVAFTALQDDEMSGVTGEGMSFVWTDFRMMFDPGSYFEQMGAPGSNTCSGTGQSSGNYNCWRRGDLRWYGNSVSSTGGTIGTGAFPDASGWASTWTTTGSYMTQCANAGIAGLGCPRGGPVALFAAHDNPYILRALDYSGDGTAASVIGNGVVTYQGVNSTGLWSPSSPGSGSRQTVLEWLAPSPKLAHNRADGLDSCGRVTPAGALTNCGQDPYRFSFWGEIEVGRGGTGSGLLKSQTLISGNAAGSVLRFFKFTQTSTSPGLQNPYDPTLGAAGCTDAGCPGVNGPGNAYNNRTLAIQYESHLQGDFRFSVAQTEAAPIIGVPVAFHATEGMYFRNADVFLPLGQPFYQALVINLPRNTSTNAPVKDGNFTLEIPILPNREAVYTRFYSLNPAATNAAIPSSYDRGYATARAAMLSRLPVTGGATPAYMPARTATSIANYPVPDANYFKTHGYAHWGDWSVCQGVGCRLPLSSNSGAQADAGTGRNSWNTSGDGVFFVGTTAFNAYAYRTTAMDVRNNTHEFSTRAYYTNYSGCTPANASAYDTCGYGGAYNGAGGGATAKTVSSVSILPAENLFWNRAGTGVGGNENRNVIAVPAGTPLNLGDARLEGIQMNYLRFTSRGANF